MGGDIVIEHVFSVSEMPPNFSSEARTFRKKVLTRAVRIAKPFTVQTPEGRLHCEDGWLALDARGYPYPIDADEFDLVYEPVDE